MKNLVALVALIATTLGAAEPQTIGSVEVPLSTGSVKGTLLLPQAKGSLPVVLLIAGSGPTDRNGNSALGRNESLLMLAEALAAKGIASVRYDKRGIGDSEKVSEADLRFDTYVDDAVTWCRMLREDKQFSRVFIAGHSEGSLIGMLAAKRCAVSGFISIAGAGRPASDLLREQLAGKLPAELAEQSEAILKGLEQGKTTDTVPQELLALYRPSVQPYMVSWIKHDPVKAVAQLKVPVLIVQGTTDIQVKADDAKKLAAANPKAKLVMIEGMNHIFKMVPDDLAKQLESYSDPTLAIAPELESAITAFVAKPK